MIGRILVVCPDQAGIVARMSQFLYQRQLNILAFDQHTSATEKSIFYSRLEFDTQAQVFNPQQFAEDFSVEVANSLKMHWHITYDKPRKRTALLVSKHDHALQELLWLWQKQELDTDISMVISNHNDLRTLVEPLGIPYHHIPFTKDNRVEAEAHLLQLMKDQVDLIVLARFMQILSEDFIKHFSQSIINIHHSFLPAFSGADPYRQAFDRGVKLIGATAHYVTKDLDAGPIIEQDVSHISHQRTVPELKCMGRELERRVLARAVQWHLADRIIIADNRTIVFNA